MLEKVVTTVPAVHRWPSNAELIADCARLGYLHEDWRTLDATFGRGTFWKVFRPKELVAHDLKLDGVDFRKLPHPDASFRVVTFDPPYKLNGTPTDGDVDERYGVDVPMRWQDKHQMIYEGIDECCRVLQAKGYLLIKCQDQVCSGAVRWQTRLFTERAESHGLVLVDRFDLIGHVRPQPRGRKQVHAHGRPSTLLVLRK